MDGLTKIKKSNVIELISYGWSRDLKVCASKQKPDNPDVYLISIDNFRDRASFERWHIKVKERMCNDINGKSLSYYIVKKEALNK